jgi:hypothetical protein
LFDSGIENCILFGTKGVPFFISTNISSTLKIVQSLFLLHLIIDKHSFWAWCLWLHRNKAVFDGVRPSIHGIKTVFLDEFECWRLAGARHLEPLGPGAAIFRSRVLLGN